MATAIMPLVTLLLVSYTPAAEARGPARTVGAVHNPLRKGPLLAHPALSPGTPAGYIPCDIRNAYHLNSTALNGAGVTIAIIDAFGSPTIASDLQSFDQTFGLPNPPVFNIVQPGGPPGTNADWATETTLDVEWAHAVAPAATIDLVESLNNQLSIPVPGMKGDLTNGIYYAANILNADVISMSFGLRESLISDSNTESLLNAYFPPQNGAGNPISYVASAGDAAFGPQWPAISTGVVGIGGTSVQPTGFGYSSQPGSHTDCSGVTLTPGVTSLNESVWWSDTCPNPTPPPVTVICGTGGGPSAFEPKPSWQSIGAGSTRVSPDVAMLADPRTGVATFQNGQWNPFFIGGTSLSAPMWSGIVALLDQGRHNHTPSLSSLNQTSSSFWLYSALNVDFNDITVGSDPPTEPNDPCLQFPTNPCMAQAGYDPVSGRGSPLFTNLEGDLAAPLRGNLTPVSPTRIMDTRDGTGGVQRAPMTPNQVISLPIPSPATSGAAIVVNVGVTNTVGMSSGYVLVSPCGQPQPMASTVNFRGGQTIANLTQVEIGSCGLNVFLSTFPNAGFADVFLDLEGYYSQAPAGAIGLYDPLNTPFRVLDTRTPIGGHQRQFQPGEGFALKVAGNAGIASSPPVPPDASAVTLNLTSVIGTAASYLSVYPAINASNPCPADLTSSNLNFPAGSIRANRVIVQVGFNGQICFFNSEGTVDVLADLGGWFSGGQSSDTVGLQFTPWTPARIYDSRLSIPIGPGNGTCPNSADFPLPIPTSINVLSYNLTGLNSVTDTYLEAFPTGSPPSPPTSDINYLPGDVQPNLVITKTGSSPSSLTICTAKGPTDFFVDVNGVYRP
jgi:hypothetical protein